MMMALVAVARAVIVASACSHVACHAQRIENDDAPAVAGNMHALQASSLNVYYIISISDAAVTIVT
jgi:hypothetical protein